jgi:hypothetical protein
MYGVRQVALLIPVPDRFMTENEPPTSRLCDQLYETKKVPTDLGLFGQTWASFLMFKSRNRFPDLFSSFSCSRNGGLL